MTSVQHHLGGTEHERAVFATATTDTVAGYREASDRLSAHLRTAAVLAELGELLGGAESPLERSETALAISAAG